MKSIVKGSLAACLGLGLLLGGGLGVAASARAADAGLVAKTDAQGKILYYYCPMHPTYHQDHPGQCPICGMTLVPKRESAASVTGQKAGLPDSVKGLAPIDLSLWKEQLIGLRTTEVERRPLVHIIRTVVRFAGGGNDFAGAAGNFTALGEPGRGGARHGVADIYALDIPYVRVGQKALVSGFAANAPEIKGHVSHIYPYDGTQSRVLQVRIDFDQPVPDALFGNAQILAVTKPMTAVPADAVVDTGLQRYAFVQTSPGHLVPRSVELGFQGEDGWQVLSGLKDGDTVVVGADFMVDADARLEAALNGMEADSGGAGGGMPGMPGMKAPKP